MKKKILSVIIAGLMALSLAGCGTSASSTKVDLRNDLAESAYADLNSAYAMCEDVSGKILSVWHEGIYDLDDVGIYSESTLAKKYGVSEDSVLIAGAAMGLNYYSKSSSNEILASMARLSGKEGFGVSDWSTYVNLYVLSEEAEGTFDNMKKLLDSAKENIKDIPSDNPSYEKLKEYYSEVSSYVEFCESPSGNYEQAGNTISGYNENIKKIKNDLSFDLD